MQLGASMTVLLAGVLLMLTANVVESVPLTKRTPQFVTLPLKRMVPVGGLHPQIYLQQQINRGVRRLARMTGRAGPSDAELVANLERRVLAIEGPEGLERRYNRMGVPSSRDEGTVLEKRFNRQGVPRRNQQRGIQSLKKGKGGRNGNGGNAGNGNAGAAGSATSAATPVNDVTFANAPTDSNSLGLDIESQDEGYLATIQMGTPPRDFLILMDSGSSDFWVGGENCQTVSTTSAADNVDNCGAHNFLGTASSSSFVDSGKVFNVTYGTGQVGGTIITDDVTIANLTLPAHTFGAASTESIDFSGSATPFDGLMGLAQQGLSQQGVPTPVESLFQANLIPAQITSFKISRLADNLNDGEVTFGGLDTSKFDSTTLATVDNVNTEGFWEGAIDSVSLNGADLGLSGRTAILDTGTTLMVLPAADAQTILSGVDGAQSDGQGGFVVPCDTTASLALTFGGQEFTIEPTDFAIQPVGGAAANNLCTCGITSGDIGGATEWLVGDVFLKNAYFSVDESKNTISLAKLV
ncbi:hypothetical protein HYPSUDRAFT_36694 [Hypholoma sublateritium FD-334 SS-4]|uniref:Peptidase A1 domain-containing protein n=1 Tax=Hypholoma sublateritium (strain FD-334 SS-4) TaxID=945553 RepID=A0A0D2Q438_HYPSF|nr:hypothetical protein HYPSUDRAFT_36694 [Hypholoma sublateritium FD-334 SS-4]